MFSASATTVDTPATSASAISQIEQGRSLLASFHGLQWMPQLGIGWYPVRSSPYDLAYWEKYRGLDRTSVGDALTECRLELVRRHHKGQIVDIGIGGGRFVVEHADARGFDVNPYAVDWLQSMRLYTDPRKTQVDAACFWDSLEHIHDPRSIMANVSRYCFVSAPIFEDCAHVLRSKHFKPDEHCWYFTCSGIVKFMERFGFEMVEQTMMEQTCGREDIVSFVFARRLTVRW